MSNYSIGVRTKRWAKFLFNYLREKHSGLDFSMVYVGELQESVNEFHGYSMTDAGDMRRMLEAVPVDSSKSAFLDVGCGKGMCLKCAIESGYQKVAGLDLDEHLLQIARRNLSRLKMDAEFICVNSVEFDRYDEFDVFYFYNPFGETIFQQVINKIQDSQERRNREIWAVYYHPVYGELFDRAGFQLKSEFRDKTWDTSTRFYCYPAKSVQP